MVNPPDFFLIQALLLTPIIFNHIVTGEHSRFIVSGDVPAGRIHLRDPLNLKVAHTLMAHSGMLSDFDVHGHHL